NVSNIEFLRDKIYFYEEFNENLKKSLENEKNKIKKLIYNNINHYFTCKKSDVIYEDPQYPSYNLYKKLIENKINSLEILKILFIVFGLLKIQSEYCKALQYKILLATLIKYYLIFL
ncbi:MAG: hypothetical protein NTU73_14165, partial [Ignavibacteriae bacterium]|nr:hypothetical protein [Ignavibacteriota bacterium]